MIPGAKKKKKIVDQQNKYTYFQEKFLLLILWGMPGSNGFKSLFWRLSFLDDNILESSKKRPDFFTSKYRAINVSQKCSIGQVEASIGLNKLMTCIKRTVWALEVLCKWLRSRMQYQNGMLNLHEFWKSRNLHAANPRGMRLHPEIGVNTQTHKKP